MKTLSAIILVALVAFVTADVDFSVLPAFCHLPRDKGHCHQHIPQWWYDSKAKKCRHFIYSGCGGNRNRFSSKAACEHKCKPKPVVPVDICKLPADSGPCEALIYRWYFNHASGECEQFQYGGCLGNENNFATRLECQQACRKDCKNVRCFVDPCRAKKCPADPDAKCVANFCTGCDADFFDDIGKLIDCGDDDCGEEEDPCDNPAWLGKSPGHKKTYKDCCHGLQCCTRRPHHHHHRGFVHIRYGTCRRHCH